MKRPLRAALMLAMLCTCFVAVPTSIVHANHPCSGDTDAQPNIDMTAGHSCTPSDVIGGGGDGGGGKITTIAGLIGALNGILAKIIPFIIALAVLVILWGLFRYIGSAGEEEKRAEGRMFILYGLIGLFVMVSIWGLVNILAGTFKLENTLPTQRPTLPSIPGA